MHTAENHPHTPELSPAVGELWSVNGEGGYAIYLGEGLWNVLSCVNDEYTLGQVSGLQPKAKNPSQPDSFHWADQFDSLAAAAGLRITWAEEILAYQAQGWNKIRKLRQAAT